MEKLENMFQQIADQLTKLTTRVAALERNQGNVQPSTFVTENTAFDFTAFNDNNKRIRPNEFYIQDSLSRLPSNTPPSLTHMDHTPIFVSPGISPRPSSPLVTPDPNMEESLSSLESTASGALAAINSLTRYLPFSNQQDQNMENENNGYNKSPTPNHEQ